jgi:glycerophosphoryl diester phosphodiesterase
LDELQKLDVGAWFSDSFRGERVPTLTEVIEEARGRVRWNVELKYNRPDPLLVRKTIAVLREANLADTCVITSLDQRAIDEVRRLAPEFKTGLILTTAMGRRLGVSTDFLSVNARQLQGSFLAAARKRGLAIHVWTVNDRDQMLRMLVWGVDNIITDEPAMLRDLINELESLSPPERLAVNLRTSILSVPRSR